MKRAAVLLVLAWIASAQEPFRETVDVQLVEVDVVVTNAAGDRVEGLQAEDFEVFENGAKQTITNFSEERRSSQKTEEQQPLNVVVFIDQPSLRTRLRGALFDALRKLINQLDANDRVMIASWSGGRLTATPFLTKRDAIEKELRDQERRSMAAVNALLERDRMLQSMLAAESDDDFLAFAQATANNDRAALQRVTNALKTLFAGVAAADGRKVLVLASGGFTRRPGIDLLTVVANSGRSQAVIGAVTTIAGSDASSIVNAVSSAASAHGITMYPLAAAGAVGLQMQLQNRVCRATADEAIREDRQSAADSLKSMAEETGGIAVINRNDFANAVTNIVSDLGSYYSLAYRATSVAADTPRAIEVRAHCNGCRVRHRRTAMAESSRSRWRNSVAANLAGLPVRSDFNVNVKQGKTTRERNVAHVEIIVMVEPNPLIETERLRVFLQSADESGAPSDIFEAPCCRLDLTVPVKTKTLSVGVADTQSLLAGYAIHEVSGLR